MEMGRAGMGGLASRAPPAHLRVHYPGSPGGKGTRPIRLHDARSQWQVKAPSTGRSSRLGPLRDTTAVNAIRTLHLLLHQVHTVSLQKLLFPVCLSLLRILLL